MGRKKKEETQEQTSEPEQPSEEYEPLIDIAKLQDQINTLVEKRLDCNNSIKSLKSDIKDSKDNIKGKESEKGVIDKLLMEKLDLLHKGKEQKENYKIPEIEKEPQETEAI